MSLGVLIGVGVLGGFGAIGRFLLDGAVSARVGGRFPWGTLAVNLSGAFALGVLVGSEVAGDALLLVGTGMLGAYTTFSTWMFESQRLAEDGQLRYALVNLLGSLVLGVAVVWLGREIGGWL
jgi:CrcB protein